MPVWVENAVASVPGVGPGDRQAHLRSALGAEPHVRRGAPRAQHVLTVPVRCHPGIRVGEYPGSRADSILSPRPGPGSELRSGRDDNRRPWCTLRAGRKRHMQIGIVGLGRMGANIARRLMRHGHSCVVYDRDAEPGRRLAGEGATAAETSPRSCRSLPAPRVVWLMLPAGATVTEAAIAELRRTARRRRHHHRRRQHLLEGRHPPRPRAFRRAASTTSMSARPAACGAWSAATA